MNAFAQFRSPCKENATAHWFGATRGVGTMPHSLIGYAGSTVRAAEMFHETFPNDNLTALTDSSLITAARFSDPFVRR